MKNKKENPKYAPEEVNSLFHIGGFMLHSYVIYLEKSYYSSTFGDLEMLHRLGHLAKKYIKRDESSVKLKSVRGYTQVTIDLTKMRILADPEACLDYESTFKLKENNYPDIKVDAVEAWPAPGWVEADSKKPAVKYSSSIITATFRKGVLRFSFNETLSFSGIFNRDCIDSNVIYLRVGISGSNSFHLFLYPSGEAMLVSDWHRSNAMFLYGCTSYTGATSKKSDWRPFLAAARIRIINGKIYNTERAYYHKAVPKKSKPGKRLISSPARPLKIMSSILNDILVYMSKDEYSRGSMQYPVECSVLSYMPGTDFVKIMAEADENMSVTGAGRYVLQIDYKDFFTNIGASQISAGIRSVVLDKPYTKIDRKYLEELSAYISNKFPGTIFSDVLFLQSLLLAGCGPVYSTCGPGWNLEEFPHEESLVNLKQLFVSSVSIMLSLVNKPMELMYKSYSNGGIEVASKLLTALLPVWKTTLMDIDVRTVKADKIEKSPDYNNSIEKYLKDRRFRMLTLGEPDDIDLFNLHSRVSGKAWALRGLPQGVCYSGALANMCAVQALRQILRLLRTNSEPLGLKINKALVYSDNLYIFYDSSGGTSQEKFIKNILMNDFRPKKWLKANKISCVDRNARDIKILGLILDKEGCIRLSRETMRKINQRYIRAYKGDPDALDSSVAGRTQWFKRVRDLEGPNSYSRKLITEKKIS